MGKRKGGKSKKRSAAAAVPAEDRSATGAEEPGDDVHGWTNDHHLVGTVLLGSAVVVRRHEPLVLEAGGTMDASGSCVGGDRAGETTTQQPQRRVIDPEWTSYASNERDQILQIACFHPENPLERQPALWRGVFKPTKMTPDARGHEEGRSERARAETEKDMGTAVAIDRIAKDLTQPASFSLGPPTNTLQSRVLKSVEERVQSVVYRHVVEDWIPYLILAAALEEVRHQCVRQAAHFDAQQQQQEDNESRSKKSSGARSAWSGPEYYRKTPSSYLTPPVNTAAAADAASPADGSPVTTISFTPNQLVARIKQGCALMYNHYRDHIYRPPPPPPLPTMNAAAAAAFAAAAAAAASASDTGPSTAESWKNERRASSRIARQQEEQQQQLLFQVQENLRRAHTSTNQNNPRQESVPASTLLWKVLLGGKVAEYLLENLFLPENQGDHDSLDGNQEGRNDNAGKTAGQLTLEPDASTLMKPVTELDKKPSPVATDDHAGIRDKGTEVGSTKDDILESQSPAAATSDTPVAPETIGRNNIRSAESQELDAKVEKLDEVTNSDAEGVESTPVADDNIDQADEKKSSGEASAMNTTSDEMETRPNHTNIAATEDEAAVKEATGADPPAAPVDEAKVTGQAERLGDDEDAVSADGDSHFLDEDVSEAVTTPEKSKDDDDDFSPGDGDDEEDDEEDTSGYVKESLRGLEIGGTHEKKEDESADQKDGEDDVEDAEDVDVVTSDNPYLSPTGPAVLEWLGRKTAKLLTSADLQTAFPALLLKDASSSKKKKKKSRASANVGGEADNLVTSLDEKVLKKVIGDHRLSIGGPSARLVLQLATEHLDDDVVNWETSYFGRTHFALRVLDENIDYEQAVQAAEVSAAAEMAYKQQKAWDTWRYKGIQGGYTHWPSWMDAVDLWWSESPYKKAAVLNDADSAMSSQQEGSQGSDTALALRLAQEAASDVATRRTRRGGDSGGVFYGNQSNMTQKQLMDALLRITSEKGYITVSGLVSAVPDDSSDPLRRIRTAVGKLLFKRNQMNRMFACTELSDDRILKAVREAPLLQVALTSPPIDKNVDKLTRYIKQLHRTELQLRQMIMKRLTYVPVAIVATAADERPGSMEALDATDFDEDSSIEWNSSGHNFLNTVIFRPREMGNTDDRSECFWFKINSYSKSLPSVADPDETAERPQIGLAKEPAAVKRRMRFRAVRVVPPSESVSREFPEETLLLTEAQVRAGLKACELERERTAKQAAPSNPFENAFASCVTLYPSDDAAPEQSINGVVVGHNAVKDNEGNVVHKVLVLPDKGTRNTDSIWVTLETCDTSTLFCRIGEEKKRYVIEQCDYHTSSPAFQQCRSIVTYLESHPKGWPFQVPVDPIALNIPHYFDTVKHPMDVSTLSKKLESGSYSSVPPNQNVGRSPIARMLNGPFRRDVELIFDNAMLFNPPDDVIHQAAAAIKKAVLKKIENLSSSADAKSKVSLRPSKSMYAEYDSDVDMYAYESDQDDDYDASRRNRKRKRTSHTVLKEDASARSIERPCRLQKVMSESTGLHGPLADLPVKSDVSSFTLPMEWTCRYKTRVEKVDEQKVQETDEEFDELLALHKQVEETESAGLRRSTRSHDHSDQAGGGTASASRSNFEYVCTEALPQEVKGDAADPEEDRPPASRLEVELVREKLHEKFFAKLYKDYHKSLVPQAQGQVESGIGRFSDEAFPPYLGRVIPSGKRSGENVWEIREPYLVVALRWVIRGLVHSGHLSEIEPMTSDSLSSGAVLANNVYFVDATREPFEVLDSRELIRKKRADQGADESSEEEVEMSEYEKLRAERVARNAERLKALGLA